MNRGRMCASWLVILLIAATTLALAFPDDRAEAGSRCDSQDSTGTGAEVGTGIYLISFGQLRRGQGHVHPGLHLWFKWDANTSGTFGPTNYTNFEFMNGAASSEKIFDNYLNPSGSRARSTPSWTSSSTPSIGRCFELRWRTRS